MLAYIYCIKNKANSHCYIGQTKDYSSRISKHLTALRGNYHCNKHLQNAYNKYGEENFEFSIIEKIEDYSTIGEREKFWIKEKGYYNIDLGREGFTPTALRNMSEAHLGQVSAKRILKKKEVLYILALSSFLDGCARSIANLSPNYSREVPKCIIQRKTYREISSFYDTLDFDKKLILFEKALTFFRYDPWKNTNNIAPKKNRYIQYIIEHTKSLSRQEVADILHMSKAGVRKAALEFRQGQREIDTTITDSEVRKILAIIVDKQYRAKLAL